MGNRAAWDPSRHRKTVRWGWSVGRGRGCRLSVLRSDLGLQSHGTSLTLDLPRHSVTTDISVQRWVQLGGCAEAVLLCLWSREEAYVLWELLWMSRRQTHPTEGTPRVLSKSSGCNPMSSPSIRRMKRQEYFWMIQNVFQGRDLLALCGVPLYRKHEKEFQKPQFCTHLRKSCKTITWYLFSCPPDGNPAVTSNSAGPTPVFDYKSKKRFGLPPMKGQGWNFCWNSPLPHDEIWCSDILFSVVTWVFMHQERNNDVITGVTLPSENKIPSIPFGSYSKALHDPDFLTLGSRLCLLALGNVIFLWEIWYLFSDGT